MRPCYREFEQITSETLIIETSRLDNLQSNGDGLHSSEYQNGRRGDRRIFVTCGEVLMCEVLGQMCEM